MLDNHEQIFDPDAPDGHRDIKPGDIVLLERAKSINNTLVNEFASLNIPLTVHGVENYFKSTEVRTIVSIVEDYRQSIPRHSTGCRSALANRWADRTGNGLSAHQ